MERLGALITSADAALALPGGPGTLTEISLMWNLMIIGALERRPLILVGDSWRLVFDSFFQHLGAYSPPNQRGLLRFAPDPAAAVAVLPSWPPGTSRKSALGAASRGCAGGCGAGT